MVEQTTNNAAETAKVEAKEVADLAAGLAARDAAKADTARADASSGDTAKADTAGAGGTEAKGGQADGGAGKGGGGDELGKMAERLKKLEESQDSLQKKREAGDAVDSFIREYTQFVPAEMLRRVLPQTTETKTLHAEMNKVQGWLDAYVKALEKRGVIFYRNIGGSGGGMGPAEAVEQMRLDASPRDLISEGLQRRGGRGR